MGTWGAGIFENDTAQDFLSELHDRTPEVRISEIREILERAASEPSVIMREYVPEEVVVAVAMVAATMSTDSRSDWARDPALQDAVAGIDRQDSLSPVAISALREVIAYQGGWLISSLKDEDDRRLLRQQLDEIERMLEAR